MNNLLSYCWLVDARIRAPEFFAYLSTHWQAQKEAAHTNDKSHFFPVGQKLFTPIVNNSSDKRFHATKCSVNAQNLKFARFFLLDLIYVSVAN